MFDSVAGGILPICLLSALAGFGLSRVRARWLALTFATVAAIAIAYAWFWVPRLLGIGAHVDAQGGWDLVATAAWSVFSVPSTDLPSTGP